MAEESFPFQELAEGDRTVSAAMFAKHLGYLRTRGVISGVDNALTVAASSPLAMSVDLDTGGAFVGLSQMRAYRNTLLRTLVLAAADPSNPRHDLLVLDMDTDTGPPDTRRITASVVTGTPNAVPVDPTLSVTETHYQIALARIVVPAAATTIGPGDLTDLRLFSTHANAAAAPVASPNVYEAFWPAQGGSLHDGTSTISGDAICFMDNGFQQDATEAIIGEWNTGVLKLRRIKRTDTGWYFDSQAADAGGIDYSWTNLFAAASFGGGMWHETDGANEYLYVFGYNSLSFPHTLECKRFDWTNLDTAPTAITLSGFDTGTGGIGLVTYDGTNGDIYHYQHLQSTGGTSLVRCTKSGTTSPSRMNGTASSPFRRSSSRAQRRRSSLLMGQRAGLAQQGGPDNWTDSICRACRRPRQDGCSRWESATRALIRRRTPPAAE